MDFALDNLQWRMCHKTKLKETKSSKGFKLNAFFEIYLTTGNNDVDCNDSDTD